MWQCLWHTVWESGTVAIALAAFLFSVGTLVVRLLEQGNGIPAFQVACVPASVCLVILTGIVWSSGARFVHSSKTVRLLTVLRGLTGAASLTLYYISIELLPLKDAVTLFFCSPVIAVVLEWLIGGDQPSTGSLAGMVFTTAGVVLVTQPSVMTSGQLHDSRTGLSLGMLCALLAAACNAIAFVIVRSLGNRQSSLTLTWWYHLVVMAVTGTALASHYPAAPVWPNTRETWLLSAVVACQFFGQILLNRGFALVSASKGSAINVLQVLFSYMWELTVLKETINLVSAVGGVCVMVGVVVVALSDSFLSKPLPIALDDGGNTIADPQEVTYVYVPVVSSSDERPEQKLRRVDSGELLPSRATITSAAPGTGMSHRSPIRPSHDEKRFKTEPQDSHGPRMRHHGDSDGETEALLPPSQRGTSDGRESGTGSAAAVSHRHTRRRDSLTLSHRSSLEVPHPP